MRRSSASSVGTGRAARSRDCCVRSRGLGLVVRRRLRPNPRRGRPKESRRWARRLMSAGAAGRGIRPADERDRSVERAQGAGHSFALGGVAHRKLRPGGLVAVGHREVLGAGGLIVHQRQGSSAGREVRVEIGAPRVGGDDQRVGHPEAACVGAALERADEPGMRWAVVERCVGVDDRRHGIGVGKAADHPDERGGGAIGRIVVDAVGQVDPHRAQAAGAVERDEDDAAGRAVAEHPRNKGEELGRVCGLHDGGHASRLSAPGSAVEGAVRRCGRSARNAPLGRTGGPRILDTWRTTGSPSSGRCCRPSSSR